MTDNFNIPSFCCIFVSRLITSIETRNVRFLTFVFSVKGIISVILMLVVAVYQQILSSTEQSFLGLLRGNRTSMFWLGGGSCNFQPCFRGGSVIFVPKGGGGSWVRLLIRRCSRLHHPRSSSKLVTLDVLLYRRRHHWAPRRCILSILYEPLFSTPGRGS